MKPYISVVVTAYNRQEFLSEALNSLSSQTITKDEFEVIVITNFKVQHCPFTEFEIQYHVMEGTAGEYMLKGIELSKGQIVCFLDDDDIFLENKLATVKKIFSSDQDVDYYKHNFAEINKNHEPTGRASVKKLKRSLHISFLEFENNLVYLTFNEPFYNSSSIALRKSVINLRETFIFKENIAPDAMLWIIAIANSNAIFLDSRILSLYRIHGDSAVHSSKGEEKYKCKENKMVALLKTYKSNDTSRNLLLKYMRIREEVMNSAFCDNAFSLRHYVMTVMMILLGYNRFKAIAILLRRLRILDKQTIRHIFDKENEILASIQKISSIRK